MCPPRDLGCPAEELPVETSQVPVESSSDFPSVVGFTLPDSLETQWKTRFSQNQRLFNQQLKDYGQTLIARWIFGAFFSIILLGQNIAVFNFIFESLRAGVIKDISVIVSVVCSATLGETIWVIKIMMEFLFTNIDYSQKEL